MDSRDGEPQGAQQVWRGECEHVRGGTKSSSLCAAWAVVCARGCPALISGCTAHHCVRCYVCVVLSAAARRWRPRTARGKRIGGTTRARVYGNTTQTNNASRRRTHSCCLTGRRCSHSGVHERCSPAPAFPLPHYNDPNNTPTPPPCRNDNIHIHTAIHGPKCSARHGAWSASLANGRT